MFTADGFCVREDGRVYVAPVPAPHLPAALTTTGDPYDYVPAVTP